jgi:hypothetical protein
LGSLKRSIGPVPFCQQICSAPDIAIVPAGGPYRGAVSFTPNPAGAARDAQDHAEREEIN